MISPILSLKIIDVVIPDQKTLFWMAAFVAAAVINPNGIKTLSARAFLLN